MEAQFLDHYNRELEHLRGLGGEFARQYPAVAGRLGLDEFRCADPFVERLLEGFAFMAARVHRRIDAEFPRFTRGLVESVFPHYARPIPAAGVIALHPDRDDASLAAGHRLPRGTRLVGPASTASPTPCRFETTDAVDLWPIHIAEVEWVDRDTAVETPPPSCIQRSDVRSYIRIRLTSSGGIPFSAIDLDRLRLHLRGGKTAHRLFELLLTRATVVAVASPDGDTAVTLESARPRPVGLSADAALLPDDPRSFSGYRLLQEYFLLPEKFLFVDIGGIRAGTRSVDASTIDILIGLTDRDHDLSQTITRDHIALHCVPIVNLFRRRGDRIPIDTRRFDHHLLVDRSRPMDFEIWSVDQLCGHGSTPGQQIEFAPLYAPPSRRSAAHGNPAYYVAERRPRQPSENQRQHGHRSAYLGTEVFLTLTQSAATATFPIRQLSSSLYCTNRDLALLQPAGGWRDALRLDEAAPVSAVKCLAGPTSPRSSLMTDDGETCWRLVQHLTPNYLSFGEGPSGANDRSGPNSAAAIRELLRLYCPPDHPARTPEADAVTSLVSTAVTRQLPIDGPIVYGRGVGIEVELDEPTLGGGAFLLATILEQFFARHVALNSFTQTTLRTTTRGEVHRWPVRLGTAPAL